MSGIARPATYRHIVQNKDVSRITRVVCCNLQCASNYVIADTVHHETSSTGTERARRVQIAILPSLCDACQGAQIAARHLGSRGIGVYYHDILPHNGSRYMLLIGDVLSHELFPALVKLLIFGAVHVVGPEVDSPSEVVRLVNSLLNRLNTQLRSHVLLSSLFVGVVNPHHKRLTHANAGHPPPLAQFYDGHIRDLAATCPILGIAPQLPLTADILVLHDVYQILFCTDGLTEARDTHKRFLERGGVVDSLRAVQGLPVEDAVAEIMKRALVYTGGRIMDDMTAVIVGFDNNHFKELILWAGNTAKPGQGIPSDDQSYGASSSS